jgi:hypothetical protein
MTRNKAVLALADGDFLEWLRGHYKPLCGGWQY